MLKSNIDHEDKEARAYNWVLLATFVLLMSLLINACRRAHEIGYYNYKTIEDILKKQLDKYEEDPVATAMPSHANIRGGNYYQ